MVYVPVSFRKFYYQVVPAYTFDPVCEFFDNEILDLLPYYSSDSLSPGII